MESDTLWFVPRSSKCHLNTWNELLTVQTESKITVSFNITFLRVFKTLLISLEIASYVFCSEKNFLKSASKYQLTNQMTFHYLITNDKPKSITMNRELTDLDKDKSFFRTVL